ncbi:MAG: cycB 5 [Clostridiales bacterium]|jgi:multiple sugar transport system substrate-binding protein|nr:cycB 5 [Clostridiales bacterium]
MFKKLYNSKSKTIQIESNKGGTEMKRFLSILLTSVFLVTMLVGCGEKKDTATTEVTPASTVKEGDITTEPSEAEVTASGDVTIWYYWENEGHQKALNEIVQAYNESQSNVNVTTQYVPFADFKKQLSIGVSAAELPDLVILDSPDHASYVTMGIFADLTGKFDVSNYFEGTVSSATLDGKLYGVPFGVNCLSLYYNTDMLAAAGAQVPTTWDELKAVALKLSTDTVSGLAFSSPQNEEGTFNFMPWVWSTGATSFEIGTDNGIKALTLAKDLVDSGAMTKEVINWTQGDVMHQFMAGNVAMMVNGPWQVPSMRAENTNGINWDVALIPQESQYASVLGGENYGVVAGGNEAGAVEFLNYATQKENVIKIVTQMGYISADSTIAATQFADDAIMQKFADQLEYAQPRGPHASWPEISDAISLAFNEVMIGAKTPADAAAEAQAKIDAIINQ